MGKKKLVAEEIIKEKQQEIEKWKTRFKQYEEMWFRSQEKCGQLQSSLKEKENRITELEEGLRGLINQYELMVKQKFAGLGIPYNEEGLTTFQKAKQLLK